MIIDQLVAQLGWDLTGEQDMKKFKQGMADAERGLSQFAARMGTFAIAAATAFAGGMAVLGKSVISTSAEFEQLEATLTTIEGSSDKARKALDWVADFAKQTPYDLQEVSEAFVRLRAYGLDPTNGLLEDLGNASSAMGKGLMQAVEMIADAATGEFERLKEFGVRASQAGDQVTFSWTENGKTLTKTVKKSGDEITRFLQDRFGARFSGAMARQSKTWNGMVANLGDTWTDFQRRVGDAGFFDAVKSQLGRAMDFVARLDADGTIDKWATSISWALTKATTIIGDTASRIARHFETLSKLIGDSKGNWEWLAWVAGAIAFRLFPFAFALGTAALALDEILTHLGGGKSVLGDFINSLARFMHADPAAVAEALKAIGIAAAGLAGASVVVGGFSSSLLGLAAAFAAVWGGFKLAKAALDYLDAKGANGKAIDNPKAKPGYIEGSGYDENGKFIYMNGSRRVDGPAVNPQAGFTQDALDWKTYMENLEGNAAKMGGGVPANAVLNDNKQDNRNQSVTVQVGGVVVQGVQNVSTAVGGAIGQAVGNAAVGRASRFEKDDAF